MKMNYAKLLLRPLRITERCRVSLLSSVYMNEVASSSRNQAKQTAVPVLPLKLSKIGFVDLSDTINERQLELFRRNSIPGMQGANLAAMRKLRLFRTARVYARIQLTESGSPPPDLFIEVCGLVSDLQLENLFEKEDEELVKLLQQHVHCIPAPFKATAELFISSFKDIDCLPDLPINIIERQNIITAFLSSFLRSKKFDLAKSLFLNEINYRFPFSDSFVRLFVSSCKSEPSLAEAFLGKLFMMDRSLDLENLKSIEQILSSANLWSVKTDVKITETGRCSNCGGVLSRVEPVLGSEFEMLRKGMNRLLEEGAKDYTASSPHELRALRQHIARLKKQKKIGRSLVVDTLNVNKGMPTENGLYKKLLAYMEDFRTVLLVSRFVMRKSFIDRVVSLKMSIFVCNRKSQDDLFALLAALEMGPDCYILSNDRYRDHRSKMASDINALFERWLRTRAVHHRPERNDYFMPDTFAVNPQQTGIGFHLPFEIPKSRTDGWDKYVWMCAIKR